MKNVFAVTKQTLKINSQQKGIKKPTLQDLLRRANLHFVLWWTFKKQTRELLID